MVSAIQSDTMSQHVDVLHNDDVLLRVEGILCQLILSLIIGLICGDLLFSLLLSGQWVIVVVTIVVGIVTVVVTIVVVVFKIVAIIVTVVIVTIVVVLKIVVVTVVVTVVVAIFTMVGFVHIHNKDRMLGSDILIQITLIGSVSSTAVTQSLAVLLIAHIARGTASIAL